MPDTMQQAIRPMDLKIRTRDFALRIIRLYSSLPKSSRLLLGWVGNRPIHVVAATGEHEIIVVTVYEPDPGKWQSGYEKRKP